MSVFCPAAVFTIGCVKADRELVPAVEPAERWSIGRIAVSQRKSLDQGRSFDAAKYGFLVGLLRDGSDD